MIPPEQLPKNVVFSSLGPLQGGDIGTDTFDVELHADDLLLISSQRLEVADDVLAYITREALRDGTPIDALARTIERRSAEALFQTAKRDRQRLRS